MRNTKTSVRTLQSQVADRSPENVAFDAKAASNLLKYASDPVRLTLLLSLADRERSGSELVDLLEDRQTTVSHHLAMLRHAGLITFRRHGKQSLCSLTTQGREITAVVRTLLRDEKSNGAKTSISIPIERKLLEDVRGFVDDPEEWFRTPNAAFEGRKPIELLGTADEPRLRNRIEAAKLGMFS